jgi:hypothetical protein
MMLSVLSDDCIARASACIGAVIGMLGPEVSRESFHVMNR